MEAGKAIMEVYLSHFNVEYKDDASPLTIADRKANDIIVDRLKSLNIPIISEETRQEDYSIRENWETCWIVDPLDGTKEFIKRNGEFTVNIALVENGIPLLGVVYVPDSKTLYYAEISSGKSYKAILNSHDTSIDEVLSQAIQIVPSKNVAKIRVVGSRSHLSEETQAFIDDLKQNDEIEMVSKGSSLKFCLIAEGNADIYPRFAPTMEWDTAAGHAVCLAVGVSVTALPANTPLVYNKENLLNPWFLVSNR